MRTDNKVPHEQLIISKSFQTSGSSWSSAESIIAGGFPASQSSVYMETKDDNPNSKKLGGTTFLKDG